MDFADIIWILIAGVLFITFLGIYLYSLRTTEPMFFWSGQTFATGEIKDIKEYNKRVSRIYLLWVIWALLFIIMPFILGNMVILLMTVLFILIIIYSIIAYRRTYAKYSDQTKISTLTTEKKEASRKVWIVVSIFGIVTVLFVVALLFLVGSVSAELDDDILRVEGTLSKETVSFEDITYVELRNDLNIGYREMGLGTFKVNMGSYSNNEFGDYDLISYSNVDTYIVVNHADGILVFNLESETDTTEFYNRLSAALFGETS